LNGTPDFSADLKRLQVEIGKSANVDEVETGIAAKIAIIGDELGAPAVRKVATARFRPV